ncbi:NADAR family protein [Pseudomonas solani]|uniref:NADAR family protein n=1 Tax=Pseudomonas solani TaxID=2731552 RepID=A0AAU7Y6D8_9PSED
MNLPHSVEQLRERCAAGESFDYLYFWGHSSAPGAPLGKACFSQWFKSPFTQDGVRYATAEHWMMAGKARLFGDEQALERILAARTPADAKALGREVRGFDDARWRTHSFELVVEGNLGKFEQNPDMQRVLLGTGTKVLVEASPVDPVWGIGLAEADAAAREPATWRGLNLLGFALMQVRERLGGQA